jgi:signal transduction histidine kinase
VFEPRETLDGGTGLGLAVVRRVADAHGWDVRVTPAELGGARFEFAGVKWTVPDPDPDPGR